MSEAGWLGSSLVRCCQRPSTSSQVSGARPTRSPRMATRRAVASAAQQLMAKRVSRYPSWPPCWGAGPRHSAELSG